MKQFALIICFLSLNIPCFSQNNNVDSSYYLPKEFIKPHKWENADAIRYVTIYALCDSINNMSEAMKIVQKENDCQKFDCAIHILITEYENSFPLLVSLLTDTTYVGYKHSENKNEIYQLNTVAGRVSCILNELTGERFAIVNAKTTYSQLMQYQKLWVTWITKLKKQKT